MPATRLAVTAAGLAVLVLDELLVIGQRLRNTLLLLLEHLPETLKICLTHGVPPRRTSGLLEGDADRVVVDVE